MKAQELIVSKWLNTDQPLSIEKLKGKVIAIHAFQMLCPGCVLHGIPQAQKLFETFSSDYVTVLGLHTVFEHHEAMQEKSLKAFLHEFRINFPVGIDKPSVGTDIPQTMNLYQMRGTPTWIIIDKKGELKIHSFGQMDDMLLAADVTKLALEGIEPNINIYKNKRN
jgi:AhpC/TSA family